MRYYDNLAVLFENILNYMNWRSNYLKTFDQKLSLMRCTIYHTPFSFRHVSMRARPIARFKRAGLVYRKIVFIYLLFVFVYNFCSFLEIFYLLFIYFNILFIYLFIDYLFICLFIYLFTKVLPAEHILCELAIQLI